MSTHIDGAGRHKAGNEWLPGFLYDRQKNRTLSPVYVPLTKPGFVWLVVLVSYLELFGGGAITLLFFFAILIYIYKNHFFYKFHEKEKVWLVEKYVLFKTQRRKRTVVPEPLLFVPEKRRKRR